MLMSPVFPRPIGGRYRLETLIAWEARVLAGDLEHESPPAPRHPGARRSAAGRQLDLPRRTGPRRQPEERSLMGRRPESAPPGGPQSVCLPVSGLMWTIRPNAAPAVGAYALTRHAVPRPLMRSFPMRTAPAAGPPFLRGRLL